MIALLCTSLTMLAQVCLDYTFTDKTLYLTGERIHVSLRSQKQSKVAYVELADTKGMVAQTMVFMNNGCGWAELPLPSDLHSGNYMLTTYLRGSAHNMSEKPKHQIISIVNPYSTTDEDDVLFLQPESTPTLQTRSYTPGQGIKITLPIDSAMVVETASVVAGNILTGEYHLLGEVRAQNAGKSHYLIPETEGHIVAAKAENGDVDNSRIVMVGRKQNLFDGQDQKDGTWLYYTNEMTNSQPTLLNGYTADNQPADMSFISPYMEFIPTELPPLQVWCTKEDLMARTAQAETEKAMSEWLRHDTLHNVGTFLSTTPDWQYDMDEYTKMNTVNEALTEFVRGVQRRNVHGKHQLFTMLEDGMGYSDWAALVLIDGVPVYDVDEILNYDARLLKYIQVYLGTYTFGQTLCRGVISCITKKGLLSNYKLDQGSRLVTYNFPQDHPITLIPSNSTISTIYWNPQVGSNIVEIPAPTIPGTYQVILKGIKRDGLPFQSVSEIKIL